MKRQRFLDWCKKKLELNEFATINYTCFINGNKHCFTSNDFVEGWIMLWLNEKAMIDMIYLNDEGDEWYVILSE